MADFINVLDIYREYVRSENYFLLHKKYLKKLNYAKWNDVNSG